MIHNFVLPEVEKRNIRRKIRDQQQSYMRDAHISIYEQILDLSSVEPSQVTVQEVCIKHEDMQAVSVNNVVRIDDSLVSHFYLFRVKALGFFFFAGTSCQFRKSRARNRNRY